MIMMITQVCLASEYLPQTLMQMDDYLTKYVLLVEKSSHTLRLYENNQTFPKLVKKFKVATGKNKGNKFVQGDRKTPEGIYYLRQFHSAEKLDNMYGSIAKQYGAGAFTSNYPNYLDKIAQKTGGGIWLHSTDDNSRINKGLDSRGCVVVVDEDLKEISKYINLKNTPMIISENINFLSRETWDENRRNIQNTLKDWQKAWSTENFNKYISHYSKKLFQDPVRGKFHSFKRYKKSVFANAGQPKIEFSNLSLFRHKDYVVATMIQNYKSSTIKDTGKKTVYLVRDKDYQWKIVHERWSAMDAASRELAFTPSQRYFK